MHRGEWQEWGMWAVPICSLSAELKVINILTSYLQVSIFSQRNEDEVGVSLPARSSLL